MEERKPIKRAYYEYPYDLKDTNYEQDPVGDLMSALFGLLEGDIMKVRGTDARLLLSKQEDGYLEFLKEAWSIHHSYHSNVDRYYFEKKGNDRS